MSFQVTVLYHQPDDRAAFDRYYEETHIPLATKIPGLRSYTVSRPGPDKNGDPEKAARLRAKAAMAQQKCQPLRDLVLDTDFFASD